MRHPPGRARAPWRAAVLLVAGALVVTAAGATPTASATLPPTPGVVLERTIPTRPFAGSSVFTVDSEGSAYVPQDNSLWLADDDGHAIYEINPDTGALKRRITGEQFANTEELGGGPRAGPSRVAEIQGLAYDPTKDTLYAYSGTCCPEKILSTAFRLTRKDGVFHLDSFQALPLGVQVEGAAWNPCDGRVYVSSHGTLWDHDYATNNLGPPFSIPGITQAYGLDFSDDGRSLFVAQPYTRVTRVDWATKTVVPGWDINLAGLGPQDIRAVEVIGDRIFVSDGSDKRTPGDPMDHAVFVFGLGGSGPVATTPTGTRKNLVGNPGFESGTCGWDAAGERAHVSLTRSGKGHTGSWSAKVTRTHAKGELQLSAVPTWVVRKSERTYNASLWVRSSKPGDTLQLRLRELYDGRYVVETQATKVELTRTWQKVRVSLEAGGPNRRITLDALVKHATKGTSFLADGARVRMK